MAKTVIFRFSRKKNWDLNEFDEDDQQKKAGFTRKKWMSQGQMAQQFQQVSRSQDFRRSPQTYWTWLRRARGNRIQMKSGWWLTYPSEKYNWDDYFQCVEK